MKNQIPLLIIASLLGLLALSAVQGHLINNTYILKKDTFMDQITGRYSGVEDYSVALDSVEAIWFSKLKRQIMLYHSEGLSRASILSRVREETKSLDTAYTAAYRDFAPDLSEGSDLRFQKRLASLVLVDSLENDTILADVAGTSILLVGEEFEKGMWHRVGRSTSQTSVSVDIDPDRDLEVIRYVLVADNLVNISGWQAKVFGEMRNLLLASVLIFILVFGLLYYSIKTLISQKKIAEVKTDFVNNITHEFKTPLATLSIATKLLGKSEMPAKSQQIVSVIERQNTRLQKLTDQVVNHALSYQEIDLNKERIAAGEYLTAVLDDFQLSQGETEISLVRQLDLEEATVMIDKFYLTSALLNILDNAVKYNAPPVEIKVNADVETGFTLLIKDNGQGIPAEHLPHLIDKFYRVGNREVHDVKGLGLGLYFANQVVKAHGGSLGIESAEGEGTCFTIQLPFTDKSKLYV